ncbi:hypothetical protein [Devosia nitrariae]|uniref:Uncharacterized protein n=1 Tax=Devosia nitrariae TaxID=2071872 RepID=A0ABQ5W1S8_9HYPH|nr:hypothetical protein [Devosia nitrariae]GLQ53620.1 hypothetical protein GCM10010862_08790 [Devosia nitrariae]
MTDFVAPPSFADLIWDEFRAPATDRFWALYNHGDRAGQRALASVGIYARKDDRRQWFVFFSPGKVDPVVVTDTITQIELDVFAAGLRTSDRAREQQQAINDEDLERREMRDRRRNIARVKLTARYGEMTDGELIAEAKREGRNLLREWGAFCVNSKRMWSFTTIDAPLSLLQAVWLTELVDRTRDKVAAARENIVAKGNAVDWHDDQIVLAVEFLTDDDMDRASSENGVGWSKADSSRGHWCRGMIRRGGADRDIGIDAARQILRKYEKQLGMRDIRAKAAFDKVFDELTGQAV